MAGQYLTGQCRAVGYSTEYRGGHCSVTAAAVAVQVYPGRRRLQLCGILPSPGGGEVA